MTIFTFSFLLLIKHILADYVLQRVNKYRKKHTNKNIAFYEIFRHVLDHAFFMFVLLLVYISSFNDSSCAFNCNLLFSFVFLLDFSTHFIIDYVKSQTFGNLSSKYKYSAIAIDQMLHGIVYIIIVYLLYK